MCVDLGRADVAVTEELLDGADVVIVLEQVGGERVPKRVAGRALRDARTACGLPRRDDACPISLTASNGAREPVDAGLYSIGPLD